MQFDLQNLTPAKVKKKLRIVAMKYDEAVRARDIITTQLAALKGQFDLLNELLGGTGDVVLKSKPDKDELALNKEDELEEQNKISDKKGTHEDNTVKSKR